MRQTRRRDEQQSLRSALLACASFTVLSSVPAHAQDTPAPAEPASQQPPAATEAPATATAEAAPAQAPAATTDDLGDEEEIVVTGQAARFGDRRHPAREHADRRDIRATGATDITELLDALAPQIGSARGRGGERPVLLLNGQRISSFRELRDLPTEAIQRVEILPEEVALKYGYRADQRVVNFILRERFRSTAVRAEARTAPKAAMPAGSVTSPG